MRSRVRTYPPLLQFLVTFAFLGFVAASVLGYAKHSLLPFTVTSAVAGLFVISVLPRVLLESAPDAELDELTELYVSRGLSPGWRWC